LFLQRYFRYFDILTFFTILCLLGIGLLFVFSATYSPELTCSIFFKKQLFGVISGLIIYFVVCLYDYKKTITIGYYGYWITMALLTFTLIKGSVGMGAQRWISLGLFNFQPAELVKLFLPAFIAYHLEHHKNKLYTTKKPFVVLVIVLSVTALMILKQPDLGTALLVSFAGLALLWLAGIGRAFFITLGLLVMVSAPLAWKFVLRPYQKQRISVFLGAGSSRKERYQIEQSQIAIGSGRLLGKGFLKGTQNKLLFLPEGRTDFIFSVINEEWGLTGGLLVLLLYLLLFIRLIASLKFIRNFWAQIFAAGQLLPIIFATVINIGMVVGLLPIVGIPLPLLSYGITHLWITCASLGCIMSVVIRKSYVKR
jgi:rod shape determining protein RodA